MPGGRLPTVGLPGQPAYYVATYLARASGAINKIHSEFESFNVEVNDTIAWKNLSLNVGFLFSKDDLYGQGLKEDSSTLSGYVASPGSKYLMYSIPYSKMIQPRIGATWAYDGQNTIYGSYARLHPGGQFAAPRGVVGPEHPGRLRGHVLRRQRRPVRHAVRRVLVGQAVRGRHDAAHRERIPGRAPPGSSTPASPAGLYFRYREGSHFWEDTNNNARVAFAPPATIGPDDTPIPKELYIPDLSAKLAQIGSGSTYVIAELDGAYTKFYEVTLESEWRTQKTYVRGFVHV